MDWELFWTAFGAIGGTIGAIATTLAVIVALWQTKFNYKKKLKLSFSDLITIASESLNNFYKYVGVTVINIGNRDVVINNWGFYLEDNSIMLIFADTSPIGRIIQKDLPYRLQIEESVTLYYDKEKFEKTLNDCVKKRFSNQNKKNKFFCYR